MVSDLTVVWNWKSLDMPAFLPATFRFALRPLEVEAAGSSRKCTTVVRGRYCTKIIYDRVCYSNDSEKSSHPSYAYFAVIHAAPATGERHIQLHSQTLAEKAVGCSIWPARRVVTRMSQLLVNRPLAVLYPFDSGSRMQYSRTHRPSGLWNSATLPVIEPHGRRTCCYL